MGTAALPAGGCPRTHSGRLFLAPALVCYTRRMEAPFMPLERRLLLLPAYLGTNSIAEALQTARGRRVLWLEILVNDQLDLSPWQSDPLVQTAYRTACRWYTQYRRLITFLSDRTPLPSEPGPLDTREYRAFAEALSFVYAHR